MVVKKIKLKGKHTRKRRIKPAPDPVYVAIDNLSEEDLRSSMFDLVTFLFAEYVGEKASWNIDKDVNGGDLIQHIMESVLPTVVVNTVQTVTPADDTPF